MEGKHEFQGKRENGKNRFSQPATQTTEPHRAHGCQRNPLRQRHSPSSLLAGAGEESRACLRFPDDYYFLYDGNNYSHPADSSCPERKGQAGPGYCGMAKTFSLCTALFLLPASLVGTGFQQCQRDWLGLLETDLIVFSSQCSKTFMALRIGKFNCWW